MKDHGSTDTSDVWQTLALTKNFHNSHLAVETVEVRSPARSEPMSWTVVRRKKAVVIAAMTSEKKFVLVRQERIPILRAIWEMPAGQIDQGADSSGRSIEEVALRELGEETGFELSPGGELIPLGCYFSSPGFTDEQAYLFLTYPVQASAHGHAHEQSESILDCRTFTAAELARMIVDDEIEDANTLSLCARLAANGFISLDPR